MRMRTGRLETGYFKKTAVPGLEWQRVMHRATGVLANTVWFGLDNADGKARMVNHTDVDATVLVALMGHLREDEAVAVVMEHKFTTWFGKHEWKVEKDAPPWSYMSGPPQGTVTGGQVGLCAVEVPLADCLAMAGILVVQNRILLLGERPGLDGLHRLEVVPRDSVAALFREENP